MRQCRRCYGSLNVYTFFDSPGIYKRQCETLKTNLKLITKQAFHLLSGLPQAMTITCFLLSIYYHKQFYMSLALRIYWPLWLYFYQSIVGVIFKHITITVPSLPVYLPTPCSLYAIYCNWTTSANKLSVSQIQNSLFPLVVISSYM